MNEKTKSAQSSKGALDAQQQRWDETFGTKPDRFGQAPSHPAAVAVHAFCAQLPAVQTILELGGGQGRDTEFFAQRGFRVTALDYSPAALRALRVRLEATGLATAVEMVQHDVRQRLPFADATFDACYSHMLYCMALTQGELESLSHEVHRVLRPGGLHIYTVRNTQDPDFAKGLHHGEKLYEDEGFIVHFFDRELVDHLAKGFELLNLEEFEEGPLPRRLYLVTLRRTPEVARP